MYSCDGRRVPGRIIAASIKKEFLIALLKCVNNPLIEKEILEAIKIESNRLLEWNT